MPLFSFVFAAEIQEALSIHAHYASSFRTVLHRPRFLAHPPQSPPLVDAVKDPNQSLSPLNVPGGDGAPASNSASLTGSQIEEPDKMTPAIPTTNTNTSNIATNNNTASTNSNINNNRTNNMAPSLDVEALNDRSSGYTEKIEGGGDGDESEGDKGDEGDVDAQQPWRQLDDRSRCQELAWLLSIGMMVLDLARPLPLRYHDCDPSLKKFIFCLRFAFTFHLLIFLTAMSCTSCP